MSTDRWMEKDVLHIYNRIFLSHIKEQNNSIYRNTYGPRSCHTEWRKSEKDQYHMIWLIYQYISTSPSRTNTKKRYPFHCRGLECKSKKSRNTWSNRQIWPWIIQRSRWKVYRVLPREHTGHSKQLFQQHKRRLYTCTSPDGQYRNQIDYILCNRKWRSSIQLA